MAFGTVLVQSTKPRQSNGGSWPFGLRPSPKTKRLVLTAWYHARQLYSDADAIRPTLPLRAFKGFRGISSALRASGIPRPLKPHRCRVRPGYRDRIQPTSIRIATCYVRTITQKKYESPLSRAQFFSAPSPTPRSICSKTKKPP